MRPSLVWITLFVPMALLAQAAPVANAIPHGVATAPAETTATPTITSNTRPTPTAFPTAPGIVRGVARPDLPPLFGPGIMRVRPG